MLSNILPLSWHLQTTAVQNSVRFTRNLWVYLTSSHMWKQLTWVPENLPPIQMDWGQTKQQERQKVLLLVMQSHVFHAEKILLLYLLSLCIKPTKNVSLSTCLVSHISGKRLFVFAVAPDALFDFCLNWVRLGDCGPARIHPNLSCSCWHGAVSIRLA